MAPFGLAWDDVLSTAITLLAGVPFGIALVAYRRTPTTRVLLFTAAFGVFFAKGVVIALEALVWEGNAVLDALELVSDALILLLFTVAILKG